MHVNQLAKDFPAKHETNGEINANTVSFRFDCFCSARGRSPTVSRSIHTLHLHHCQRQPRGRTQIEFIYLDFCLAFSRKKTQNYRVFAAVMCGGQSVCEKRKKLKS